MATGDRARPANDKRRTRVWGRAPSLLAGGAAVLLVGGQAGSAIGGNDATAAPPETSFQKVTLNSAPGEPMGLAVLPDGRVLHTARRGRVSMHDPATGFNTVIATIPVYDHDEEGLQGIAIDSAFEENHWVYIYYSPALDTPRDSAETPDVNEGAAPATGTAADFARFRGVMRLSRFRLVDNTLALDTEQIILDVPVDRGMCCHVGGQIDFDRRGNLYLSTGDDTASNESNGSAAIDERPGRNPAYDAQRSSANTNDLRGKLLRIRVHEDGSYSIPGGNLFEPGRLGTRPEIYAMGLRNPFRFAIDRRSGNIYLADYSPDATDADPARGPAGQGKWTIIRKPGNYGWPYCATPDLPYIDYDFATGSSGEPFDCSAPVNDSPNNTGLRELPRVEQPNVWYGSDPSVLFPELGEDGVAPMAGPAYHFDPYNPSTIKWPEYFDGVPLFYEWSRDMLFEFRLGKRRRELAAINRLIPSIALDNPIDAEFGPDGALYVLEYGDGYFIENPNAQLSRIDYVRGNFTPVPVITPELAYFGTLPVTLQLSSDGTTDPDGDAISVFWDFDADGVVDSTEPNPTVTFDRIGSFRPSLRVVDSTGRSATASARIIVGYSPAVLTFVKPTGTEPFEFGDAVSYEVRVDDDDPVDCARLKVEYVLVHDQHGHSLSEAYGCTGTFQTQPLDEGHADEAVLAGALAATYTDIPPDPSIEPVTSQSFIVLFPTSRFPPAADAGAP